MYLNHCSIYCLFLPHHFLPSDFKTVVLCLSGESILNLVCNTSIHVLKLQSLLQHQIWILQAPLIYIDRYEIVLQNIVELDRFNFPFYQMY